MLDDISRILEEYEDLSDTGQPQTAKFINEAEFELGLKFPRDFRDYLTKWGWISFGPNKYFGIGNEVNSVVNHTLRARDQANVPSAFVVICDHEGDEYVCIDTLNCSEDECMVAIWDVPSKQVSRIRSKSFLKFILSDLQDFIEYELR